MNPPSVEIDVSYNASTLRGSFRLEATHESAIWERLTQRALALETDYAVAPGYLDVPWSTALSIIREFAPLQRKQGFHFRPVDAAKEKIEQFVRDFKAVQQAAEPSRRYLLTKSGIPASLGRLHKAGSKNFSEQRILGRLLALANGANFPCQVQARPRSHLRCIS